MDTIEGCNKIREDLSEMEQLTLKIIRKMGSVFVNKIKRKEHITDRHQIEEKLRDLKQQKQRIQTQKINSYEKYKAGKFTRDEFIQLQKTSKEKLKQLDDDLLICQKNLKDVRERNDSEVETWITLESLKAYDPKIISKVIEKVVLYGNGQIKIQMKNRSFIPEDENKTII